MPTKKTQPKNQKDGRARAWTMIVYPESAPENWKEQLDNEHITWACVLHDKDANPDGTRKKAHYHVLLLFEGKKSYEQIKEISDSLHAPVPQRVTSVRGMVRYMIHMDNPEKYQYDRAAIEPHGGIDIDKYFELSVSQVEEVLSDMSAFILENSIDNFGDFISYCLSPQAPEGWFGVAATRATMYLNKVIDSVYQKQKNATQHAVAVSQVQQKLPEQDELTERQDRIWKLKRAGISVREIAKKLKISESTVNRELRKTQK